MTQTQEVGTPVRRGPNRWWVPSGKVGYVVAWLPAERRYRRCCSGVRFKPHLACKHMLAVKRFRAQERGVSMG
jgi:hypothetical protein